MSYAIIWGIVWVDEIKNLIQVTVSVLILIHEWNLYCLLEKMIGEKDRIKPNPMVW